MGYVSVEDGVMRLGNGHYIPRIPDGKCRKQRVDDYWALQGKPRGTALGLIKQLRSQMVQYGYENITEYVGGMYDTRDDELRSLRAQLVNRQVQQPVQPQIMQRPPQPHQQFAQMGGNVQTQAISNPPTWDVNQLIQLLDIAKNKFAGGNVQEQFVTTRTGARTDGPGPSNF